MRKFSILLLILLIPGSLLSQNIEGNIFLISGKDYKTRIKGSKEWVTNTTDTVLKTGLRIKTDENTSLRIYLKDRFIIFVAGDSDVNFTKLTESEELITVLKGIIVLNTLETKVKGIINTPTAEIIREKPAEIMVKVNSQDGTTDLVVMKEEVSVKNLIQSDNNYKVVKQGTFSKILPQVLPTEPSPFRIVDIGDSLKRARTPISSTQIVFLKEDEIFNRFIDEFQFDKFFSSSAVSKTGCKDIYTSPSLPVDFEKNLISRDSILMLNIK